MATKFDFTLLHNIRNDVWNAIEMPLSIVEQGYLNSDGEEVTSWSSRTNTIDLDSVYDIMMLRIPIAGMLVMEYLDSCDF